MRIELTDKLLTFFVPTEDADGQFEVGVSITRDEWTLVRSIADAAFGRPKQIGDLEHFEKFWSAYPKHVAKEAARRAWGSGRCDSSAALIVACVEQWSETNDWQKEGGKFIPHPATFLGQKRWLDGASIEDRSFENVI